MEKLKRVLEGKQNNYLYPFFWQHGESDEVLTEYMDKIFDSGMKAACIEARPHPDFVGPGWWEDLRLIICKAQEKNMKLWILDDSHFPTGYADGRIKEEYPHLKKWYLDMRRFDVAGPVPNGKVNMQQLKGRPWEPPTDFHEEPVLGIFAAQRVSNRTTSRDPIDECSVQEITEYFEDGILTWDIPKGSWSIFVLFMTRKRGEEATQDYLNPLVREATQVLIDTVYEPHYEQLGDEFGKTILGFFSDEPRFGNEKGTQSVMGKEDMVLPWRAGLDEELGIRREQLLFLFADGTGVERDVRHRYMDVVTKLYNENFTRVLVDWCEAHGVDYLGHNIEDNGAHSRLGYGAGHFFRAQEAQHFSGIDVIGTQVVPGMAYHHDGFSTGGCDGEFYHYALAKLGASAAHLDEKKQGRAMCEAFGAYGWSEGLKLMKWITDHLVVRGINYIVPHAFDPKQYPDWDCPPHFYAHGHNPQFRYFKYYSAYANRMMELLNGGVHRAPVAVLYPAEMEWMGDYMPVERPVRELTEMQIDCDIVSADYLKQAELRGTKLLIGREEFSVLVVPGCDRMPEDIRACVEQAAQAGVPVLFADRRPDDICAGACVPLQELAQSCDSYREIKLDGVFRDIVYYHYEQEEMQVFMLFNEHLYETYTGMMEIPYTGRCYEYDAWENEIRSARAEPSGPGQKVWLELAPYESKILLIPGQKPEQTVLPPGRELVKERLETSWTLAFAGSEEYPEFRDIGVTDRLRDVRECTELANAAGTVRYETDVQMGDIDGSVYIEIDQAYEVAEVFVNGSSAGVRICPPYRFDITDSIGQGINRIAIEVTNTLGNANRDSMSQYLVIEPFGIAGDVFLCTEKKE